MLSIASYYHCYYPITSSSSSTLSILCTTLLLSLPPLIPLLLLIVVAIYMIPVTLSLPMVGIISSFLVVISIRTRSRSSSFWCTTHLHFPAITGYTNLDDVVCSFQCHTQILLTLWSNYQILIIMIMIRLMVDNAIRVRWRNQKYTNDSINIPEYLVPHKIYYIRLLFH